MSPPASERAERSTPDVRNTRTLRRSARRGRRSAPSLPYYQGSERCQVFHVLVQIGRLGRLQAAGRVSKAGIVDDVTESLAADFSLADPSVTIHARAEVGFRVV